MRAVRAWQVVRDATSIRRERFLNPEGFACLVAVLEIGEEGILVPSAERRGAAHVASERLHTALLCAIAAGRFTRIQSG